MVTHWPPSPVGDKPEESRCKCGHEAKYHKSSPHYELTALTPWAGADCMFCDCLQWVKPEPRASSPDQAPQNGPGSTIPPVRDKAIARAGDKARGTLEALQRYVDRKGPRWKKKPPEPS